MPILDFPFLCSFSFVILEFICFERFYNFYPNWERGSASLSVSREIEVLSPTLGVFFN